MKKQKYRITTPDGIDEKIFVPINGQNQYIFIRGKDIRNPVILNLHGGPASPDGFMIYEFAKEICDDYTLVTWDQRGCGRTYYKNKKLDSKGETVTFEQALNDVDEIVKYLCKRFDKEKIIIMGHSYGTLLGVSYVHRYPKRVDGYIGIGQQVSLKATATENYNEIIADIGENPKTTKKADKLTTAYNNFIKKASMENLMELSKITIPYFSANITDINEANEYKLIFSSPDLAFTDFRWLIASLSMKRYNSNKTLMDYTLNSDIYNVGKDFLVPMFFISGEYDKICSVNLAKKYCKEINAPLKEIAIIKRCGHSPQVDAPTEFADKVKYLLKKIYD